MPPSVRAATLAFIIAVAACGAPTAPRVPAAPPSSPATARLLAADTDLTTPSGATVQAPRGWWLTTSGATITLADPDRALTLVLVEEPESDGARAIAAAWQRVHPGFALAVDGEPDLPPPTRGWDAVTEIAYVTPTADHRAVHATARRHGATSYVALLDGDAAAVARREAQIETTLGTVHPRGMTDESFAGQAARAFDAGATARLDAFVADARAHLAVPGAAVAVIAGGKVVYERAVGVRELGGDAPVTPTTLFLLASVSKPMTTLMEASLVDAGVLAWDTPITKLLPDFALGDPDVTRKLVLWHMSCACTGMPRQDMEDIFEYGDISPETRLASMRTMKPTTGFGETFQYSNLMVAAGGFAAAHAFDVGRNLLDAYATAMKRRVFDPIGMTSSTVDIAVAARLEHASPHALAIDGAPRPLPLAIERAVVPIAPAGAVWTNLRDFERYAQTELAHGVAPGGRRVVSEANLLERWKARVKSGDGDAYGLGIGVDSYHGLRLIDHDGGAFGYGTSLFMLPDQGVAILVLTNVRDGGGWEQLPFNAVFKRKVIEELFVGAKDLAQSNLAYYAQHQRRDAAAAQAKLDRTAQPGWAAYLAGTYHNDSLGKATVTAGAGGGAIFDAGEWKSAFGRQRDDDGTVKIVLLDPPFAGGTMVIGGDREHPTLAVVYGQTSYVFTRTAKPAP
jgi:CubicO group peptidase (beta-lactamase class C family)